MKLAAIYNVWDGVELLSGSMRCVKDHVDVFIIVWQDVSNYGEEYNPMADIDLSEFDNVEMVHFVPFTKCKPADNEKLKRSTGLELAKQLGCTHFLHMDCDEYYEDFGAAKEEYIRSGCVGSVCEMWTYFQSPEWRLKKPDNYFVPFIHRIDRTTGVGFGKYPYYVDPTRAVMPSINDGYKQSDIALLKTKMHHFSWVRKNIERKVRNSTARKNIEASQLLKDYRSTLHDGYFLQDYGQEVVKVVDLFDISI